MEEVREKSVSEITTSVETESVKCEGCGSNLVFDPDTQKLKCPHCGFEKEFDTSIHAQERAIANGLSDSRKWTAEEAVVFRCENCGAKVVLSVGESAKSCPFCGTAHVCKLEELAGIKPNAVIPFAFDEKKATEFSKAWAKKRFFAPRSFKKNISTDNVKGVYTPCFTFDSQTFSHYSGRLGKTRTRTVGSGKNRRTETYTVWFDIGGTYALNFDDVLITAGSKFNQGNLDKISPFDTNESKEYQENYLLGYMAYHYDQELTDCWGAAKSRMDKSIESAILRQYSYDKVGYLNVSTSHSNVTFKYVMLPVYVGNYKFKQKLYNFFVNGSTGRVFGKTPKSWVKILATVLLSIAVVAGVFLLVHMLQ